MAGPILQSDTKVEWASRTNSPMLARAERVSSMPPTSSPDPRSPRIVLPLAEQRFADTSPSPYLTPSSADRNPHDLSPSAVSEGTTPLSLGGHNSPFDIYGMHIPGTINDANGLQTPNRETASAPAELHQLHRKITIGTPETKFSAGMVPGPQEYRNSQSSKMRTHSTPLKKHAPPLSPLEQAIMEQSQQELHEFHLDRAAPIRALRHPPASSSSGAGGQFGNPLMGIIEEQSGQSGTPESLLAAGNKGKSPKVNDEEPERAPSSGKVEGAIDKRAEEPPTWGEPFKLEWIKTDRLPFYRTRHLRNPWNHDREIKVSRDGTELEPNVGQALLEEWDRAIEELPKEKASQQTAQGGTGGSRQQGRGKTGGGQRGKR